MELYRQPYCGCIYSEQERYDKKLQKKMRQKKRDEQKS
jgi:predicted adenine nucleotide alpha hydrolase (AANH) superfamily ATPase